MNLIEQAESDLSFVLEDDVSGFGISVIVISPAGDTYSLVGQSTDIGLIIDPNTGIGVRGRTAEITFRLSTVLGEIGEIPDKSETGTGWLLQITNVNGDEWTFAVGQADVDRKLGLVKIALELVEYDV